MIKASQAHLIAAKWTMVSLTKLEFSREGMGSPGIRPYVSSNELATTGKSSTRQPQD